VLISKNTRNKWIYPIITVKEQKGNQMAKERINIFVGHFGSGKTEVAVNFALNSASESKNVAIVDLDIVNPYFRTADAKRELESKDIWVITPMYANTNVDVPALPPEMNTLFEKKEYDVILDIGGDDLGAKVLARFKDELVNQGYCMYFVVNTKRPMTDTVEKIEHMIYEIESSSGLKVSKLVNNTNLLEHTDADVVVEGHRMIEKVSDKLKIPIGFVSGFADLIDGVEKVIDAPVFPLNKLIKLPWN